MDGFTRTMGGLAIFVKQHVLGTLLNKLATLSNLNVSTYIIESTSPFVVEAWTFLHEKLFSIIRCLEGLAIFMLEGNIGQW